MHVRQLALRSVALLALFSTTACKDDITQPASVYVTANNAAPVRAERGGNAGTVVLNVARTSGGTATVELQGVPAGVTATLASNQLAPGIDTTTVSFVAAENAHPGTYIITVLASSDGLTDSHRLALLVPGVEVAASTTQAILNSGATQNIGVTVTGHANTAVNWTSSNTAVATVSSTGVVTAVAPGTATITARSVADPTKAATVTVRVRIVPGVDYTGLSGPTGSDAIWVVAVPAGATKLTITTAGGTGDVDVYVGLGAIPPASSGATTAGGCHSWNDGNNETCVVTNPAAGNWFIRMNAWAAYAGVTLRAVIE
jgi:serine protease